MVVTYEANGFRCYSWINLRMLKLQSVSGLLLKISILLFIAYDILVTKIKVCFTFFSMPLHFLSVRSFFSISFCFF